MTSSNSTLSILFFASVASATVTPLPYDINPVHTSYENIPYNVKKELSEWTIENMSSFSHFDLSYAEQEKLDTILEFTQKLISDSKDIDSEFVEIVNEHFWDLI